MKRFGIVFIVMLAVMALVVPAAHAQTLGEFSVECGDGTTFSNGIEFQVVQMRAGYNYTATVVGLNGFDPVLAVLNPDMTGLCSDDEAAANEYAAHLPTMGQVAASPRSAQLTFNHNDDSGFLDISLVVGGYGDARGEFILILEGMAATADDNAGDIYAVRLTESMVQSGLPLTMYALTRGQSQVDPGLANLAPGSTTAEAYVDSQGRVLACDDAGTASCYGDTVSLEGYSVTLDSGVLPGWQYDSYLTLPIQNLALADDADMNWVNLLAGGVGGSEGEYLVVFHASNVI